jgi:hypothetical protein
MSKVYVGNPANRWVPPAPVRAKWLQDNKFKLSQEEKLSEPFQTLLEMHTYMRPSGSKVEAEFIKKYIRPLPGCWVDGYGNHFVKVKRKDNKKIRTVFSSHTDTVHNDEGMQKLRLSDDWLSLPDKSESNCLGADCTVGVWLMIQMIKEKVPGLYIFHRDEEIGGKGSAWIKDKTPALLKGYDIAIAFDRKGNNSIITRQRGRVCASDAFALSLGDSLMLDCYKDVGGTFTDTANYTHLIPECTNISVGYYNQHTSSECVDLRFVYELLASFTNMYEEDSIEVVRDHLTDSFYQPKKVWTPPNTKPKTTNVKASGSNVKAFPTKEDEDWLNSWPTYTGESGNLKVSTYLDLIKEYPEIAQTLLEELGTFKDGFIEEVFITYGFLPH